MKTLIDTALRSIRKHTVVAEVVLIGFAVIAFFFAAMTGLPDAREGSHKGYTVTIEPVESTATLESVGS